MNHPSPFEQAPAPTYPLDDALARTADLVSRTMPKPYFSPEPFRDRRIDHNPFLHEVADRAAFDYGDSNDREADAESFVHGMRCGFALARGGWIYGTVRLETGVEADEDEDSYPQLMEAVAQYRNSSRIAEPLIAEARPYVEPDVASWQMARLGMYAVLYMANAGEIAKDRADDEAARHWEQERVITRYERQLREEGDFWAQTDAQLFKGVAEHWSAEAQE